MGTKINGLYSLIKEEYSFDGFTVANIENNENEIIVNLRRNSRKGLCPRCGEMVGAEELIKRKVRSIDLVKKCYNEFMIARIKCNCGYRGMEKLDFVGRHGRHTRKFEQYVASLTKRMKIRYVADMCDLDLKTVKSIINRRFTSEKKNF